MKLSICLITKNECIKLERCLRAIKAAFGDTEDYEIVVVDTGSTDNTVEMVKKYTESLYHFEWIGDFAAAKNFAAASAKNNIVFILDSDEYIRSDMNVRELFTQIEQHKEQVGRMRRVNDVHQGEEITKYTDFTNRIFDRRRYCFRGKIHEQLVRGNVFEGALPEDKQEAYATYQTVLSADHDGYIGSPEEVRKKAERNLKLLLNELQEKPDDTYILYQIGKSYFMMEDNERAVEYLGKALEYEVEPQLEYVVDLVETYGYALINTGNAETAVLLESVAAEFGNSADFWFMLGLAFMNAAQFDKAIDCFLKAKEVGNAKMQGVDSYLADYNCGVICECRGDTDKARNFYEKSRGYERSRRRIAELCSQV